MDFKSWDGMGDEAQTKSILGYEHGFLGLRDKSESLQPSLRLVNVTQVRGISNVMKSSLQSRT